MPMSYHSIAEFLRERPRAKQLIVDLEAEHGSTPFSRDTLDKIVQHNGIKCDMSMFVVAPIALRHEHPPSILVPPYAYEANLSHELCHILLDTSNEITCEYFSALAIKKPLLKTLWSSAMDSIKFGYTFRQFNEQERVEIGSKAIRKLHYKGYPTDILLMLAEEYVQTVIPRNARQKTMKKYLDRIGIEAESITSR